MRFIIKLTCGVGLVYALTSEPIHLIIGLVCLIIIWKL